MSRCHRGTAGVGPAGLHEDVSGPRPTMAVSRWLRELPTNGCRAPKSWTYILATFYRWANDEGDADTELSGLTPDGQTIHHHVMHITKRP